MRLVRILKRTATPGTASSKTAANNKDFVGAWLSLVERTVRDREVGGSNPLAPTKLLKKVNQRTTPGGGPSYFVPRMVPNGSV